MPHPLQSFVERLFEKTVLSTDGMLSHSPYKEWAGYPINEQGLLFSSYAAMLIGALSGVMKDCIVDENTFATMQRIKDHVGELCAVINPLPGKKPPEAFDAKSFAKDMSALAGELRTLKPLLQPFLEDYTIKYNIEESLKAFAEPRSDHEEAPSMGDKLTRLNVMIAAGPSVATLLERMVRQIPGINGKEYV